MAKIKDYTDTLEIRKSKTHGKGLYTTVEIPKGARVIEYVGEKVDQKEAERRSDLQEERSKKNKDTGAVYLFTLNSRYDIDGNVPYNTARLINHSCSPNCEVDIINNRIWILSRRKIKVGEELSYDYGFNMDDWKNHPCKCGAPNCLGFIVSSDRRGALSRVLKKKAATKVKAKATST